MVIHRNSLRLLVTLSACMFFSSVQASNSENKGAGEVIDSFKQIHPVAGLGYWQWFKKFFNEGYYPSDISISIDGKNESHRRVSDVIITTVLVMGTVKVLWPIIDYVGDGIGVVIEDYLPNVGPIKDFKDKNKQKREQAEIDDIIARYEHEEKVAQFKERTGVKDIKDLINKTHYPKK